MSHSYSNFFIHHRQKFHHILLIITRLIVFIASKFIVNNNLKDKHRFSMIYYKRLRYLFFYHLVQEK
ncbi:hypothetical protein EAP08_03530 [Salmonella enterica]|nr:hypothetical protein [Salmonella enterica]